MNDFTGTSRRKIYLHPIKADFGWFLAERGLPISPAKDDKKLYDAYCLARRLRSAASAATDS